MSLSSVSDSWNLNHETTISAAQHFNDHSAPANNCSTSNQLISGFREDIVIFFIEEAQALILDRFVMPTIDRRFDSLCHEMAGLLGCHVSAAVQILAPAVQELYQAAQEKADQRRMS